MIYLKIIILLILIVIIYQDFRYLEVSWILFPVMLISSVWFILYEINLKTLFLNTGINLCFLCLLLGFVTAYIFIKEKKITKLPEYLGMGDIIFLVIVSILLSPVNYIIFNIFSYLLILLTYSLLGSFRKKSVRIPLAGLQAAFLFILILLSTFISDFSLINDNLALRYILNLYG